ncbi:MAG TPA: AP2 domain-containing protein [Rubrivivax sp.]|nr:AP2 domain-containing protein [Rubrivivax sp.]HRY86526.1 AP2 domain-containing protein [Rubrivivax sp.]
MKTIDISTKKHPGTFAVVDDGDYDALRQHCWYAMQFRRRHVIYAARMESIDGRRVVVLMHRQVLGCLGRVDHADGDGLNNQRHNLREATAVQNGGNSRKRALGTSAFKGVSWHAAAGKWRSQIKSGKKRVHLGLFDDEVAAAMAYDAAASAVFGKFAHVNFNKQDGLERA